MAEGAVTTATTSCIYEGTVRHKRYQLAGISPIAHGFRLPVFMMYLDLSADVLPTTFDSSWFWSVERWNIASFLRRDYFGDPSVPLDDCVRALVKERSGIEVSGRVCLLTSLRYWGVSFNPVTIFYCFDAAGASIEAVVLDVSNTPWLERRQYVLPGSRVACGNAFDADGTGAGDGEKQSKARVRHCFEKDFHVSPFQDALHDYDWSLSLPGETLDVQAVSWRRAGAPGASLCPVASGRIGDADGALCAFGASHATGGAPTVAVDPAACRAQRRTFFAGLQLRRRPLSYCSLVRTLLRYPCHNCTVQLYIHLHAAWLLVSGCTFVTPPASSPTPTLALGLYSLVLFAIAGVVDIIRRVTCSCCGVCGRIGDEGALQPKPKVA